jgi:hypothetical protein
VLERVGENEGESVDVKERVGDGVKEDVGVVVELREAVAVPVEV